MDFDYLYTQTLKYLNYRPRSEKEIRDYLAKKLSGYSGGQSHGKSESLIEVIILKLKAQRFLNDREFAKMWVRSRSSYKPEGERLIRLELQQKGISKEIIDEVFANTEVRVHSDFDLAVELLEKNRKKYEGMGRQERFNKAGSMLARRGYKLDIIRKAIDQVFGK